MDSSGFVNRLRSTDKTVSGDETGFRHLMDKGYGASTCNTGHTPSVHFYPTTIIGECVPRNLSTSHPLLSARHGKALGLVGRTGHGLGHQAAGGRQKREEHQSGEWL